MKKTLFVVLTAFMMLLSVGAAFGSAVSIDIVNHDPNGLTKNLPGYIQCNGGIGGEFAMEMLSWEVGSVDAAPLPSPEMFESMIDPSWTGTATVNIYMRAELAYDKASKSSMYTTPKYEHIIQINDSGNYQTQGQIGFSVTAVPYDNGDAYPDLGGVEKFVCVDAKGGVQVIGAFGEYSINRHRGELSTIASSWRYGVTIEGQYGAQWGEDDENYDIRQHFPLRIYGVSVELVQHEITVAADETKGSVVPMGENGKVTVNQGSDSTFTITANSGYRIAYLLIDGGRVEAEDRHLCTYTFTSVAADHTISAVFEEDTNAPEVSAADSGITSALIDVIETASDAEVSALEEGGFVSGGQTIRIVDASTLENTGGAFTADAGGFVQAVKLNVEYDEGAESGALTLTVKPSDAAKPFSADKSYYALLLNKKTNYYDLFPAALNGEGNLEIRIKPVGDYFSEGTIFIYSGTAQATGESPTPVADTSGAKSGSGCAAGLGALALLALIPLALRRKR
ncbi:MAG: Synerg-CTERM sorting domain-containing protein [Synergistaceae bacterium]|nr:Synerg-CTERM sorting domain-containing protein [Synergistaceae bacterium]